ncbi:MAG: hypothetical protein Q9182_000529 [Xanthomendoza sp. 2 TL-2023]
MATSPLYVATRHDLEDIFTSMRPCFEGKESEDNFKLRDQAISKLRRIVAGNAPVDLTEPWTAGIKALLEGIIKVINSLRTTVSKNACDLIQDMAKAKIPNMDNIAEIVLPHLMKLCAATKKIAADKANESITLIITNVSYNIYLMKLIWSACEDKNVQPRKFATGWLKTLVGKHREHKHVFEKGDGLLLFEKCLKKGLSDSNPDVRQSMRPTYWAFIRLWPERSDAILSALSDAHRKVLMSESSGTTSAPAPPKAAATTATKPKTSIKDTIAAKRQAAKADSRLAAPATLTASSSSTSQPVPPAVSTSSSSTSRSAAPANSATSSSTSHPVPPASSSSTFRPPPPVPTTRSLSSAPVRPSRAMKKPTAIEVKRPISPGSITSMAAGGFSPKREAGSPILTLLRDRSRSPVSPKPMSTTAARGLSPNREIMSPPLITILRERSKSPPPSINSPSPPIKLPAPPAKSPAPPVKPATEAFEIPRVISFDRPMKPVLSRKEGLARKALEELPINEPLKRGSSTKRAHGEAVSRDKWVKVERHQLNLSTPKDEPNLRPASVESLRHKMLVRINDIRCRTYRISTFREIQIIIRGSWPVLGDDPELFDELLFAVFDLIEHWDMADPSTLRDCGSDLYTQTLITLRVMLRYHNNLFSIYYPRAICALLSAARSQQDSTHMRFGLEDTVKAVINECDVGNLEDSIDSVLDYLETYIDPLCHQPEHLGLLALIELMKLSDPERLCRPEDQADRLGRLAARAVRSPFPEMRSRAVDFAMTYASFLADEKRFWQLASEVSNDRARLLTYYFTKERVLQAFKVEEDLLDRAYSAPTIPLSGSLGID